MNMYVREKLEKLTYKFFLETYDDTDIAATQSKNTTDHILKLASQLEEKVTLQELSHTAHTLKHLLLYADLDNVSDMCQELETAARKGYINIQLKDKIIQEIVK